MKKLVLIARRDRRAGRLPERHRKNLETKIDEHRQEARRVIAQGGRGGPRCRRAAAAPAASRAGSREDLRDADRRRSVRRPRRREGHARQGVRLRVPVLREGPRHDGRPPQEVRQRSARRLQAVRRPPAGRDGRRARVLRGRQAGQGDEMDARSGTRASRPASSTRTDRGRHRSAGRARRLPDRPRLREGARPQRRASSRPT